MRIIGPLYQAITGQAPPETGVVPTTAPIRRQGSTHQIVGPLYQAARSDLIEAAPDVPVADTIEEATGMPVDVANEIARDAAKLLQGVSDEKNRLKTPEESFQQQRGTVIRRGR